LWKYSWKKILCEIAIQNFKSRREANFARNLKTDALTLSLNFMLIFHFKTNNTAFNNGFEQWRGSGIFWDGTVV